MTGPTRGIDMPGSTRPTRAQRREEARRVHTDPGNPRVDDESTPHAEQETGSGGGASSGQHKKEAPVPKLTLPTKKKPSKRPFATQIQASTQGRLEWVQRHGHALTDTVDAAINAYLDAAGVPQADEHGTIIEP